MPFAKLDGLTVTIPLDVGKQDEILSKDLVPFANVQTEDLEFTGTLYISIPTAELIIMDVKRRGIVLGDACKISIGPYALAGFNRLVTDIKKRDM